MASVGPHVTRDWVKKGTIAENIVRALEVCQSHTTKTIPDVCQVFVAGPRSTRILISDGDEAELKQLSRDRVKVYAHGSYLDFPWRDDDRRKNFIKRELEICDRCEIKGLVIHTSETVDVDETIRIASGIVEDCVTTLLLEVGHSRNHYYCSAEGMAELVSKLRPNIGICIDIGHLWASGVPINSAEQANEWIRQSHIGDIPRRRLLFHFNDSVSLFNSGKDKHAELMRGLIWRGRTAKNSGLGSFAKFAKTHNIPVILERKPKSLLENDYRVLDDVFRSR